MAHFRTIIAYFRRNALPLLLVAALISCSSPPLQLTETASFTSGDPHLIPTPTESRGTVLLTASTTLAVKKTNSISTTAISTPMVVPQKPEYSIVAQWSIDKINDLTWLPDSTSFAITFGENDIFGIRLYDAISYQEIWSTETGMAFGIAVSPDGQQLAISPYFDSVQLRDVATGDVEVDFSNNNSECGADLNILFNPDGNTIVTTRSGGGHGNPYETRVYSWNAVKEQCNGKLFEEDGWLGDIAFNRDGQLIALALSRITSDKGNQIHIWDVNTAQRICDAPGAFVEFSPSINYFATRNNESKGIELWDAERCSIFQSLGKGTNPISLAFHPDGQLLATGGQSIQIWDIISGDMANELTGLSSEVKDLLFSPDGRFLLSVNSGSSLNEQSTLTLWKVSQ